MRKFFLIQAIIIVLGVVSLLLVRNNVHDYRLLVTGDETAVADLPARLHYTRFSILATICKTQKTA